MLRRSFAVCCAAAAAEPLVKVDVKDKVAVLTLNRPKALNALNGPIAKELAATALKLDKDNDVHVLVITGAGRAFVAGADIKAMQAKTFADWNENNMFADLELLRNVRKPMIAAVNGFALGGGCELAMICDFIIASDKAKFGQPEIKLGTIPGIGGTMRLTQLIGKAKAMEWTLSGNQYSAEEAERAGLVARVVPHDNLLDETLKIATTIAGYSRLTTAIAKDCVNKSLEMSLTEGLAYEKRSFQASFATADQKEGMKAFMEKRAPVFEHK